MASFEGSCACGKTNYTIERQPLGVTWCYCITCQKQGDAPFLAFAGFDSSSISWSHQPGVWKSSRAAERLLCQHCGSVMAMQYVFEPERIAVACATIIKGDIPGPDKHIFLKDKPSWFDVPDDGAERLQSFSDAFAQRAAEWKSAEHVAEDEDVFGRVC